VIYTSFIVTVDESSWIAVMASWRKTNMATVGDSLFAHSGPVYFYLNGARILETESAQELVEWVADFETLVITEGEWANPGQSVRVFEEIDAASAFYSALASGAVTGVDGEQSAEPGAAVAWLEPARPNPFESDSALWFSTPAEGHVRLSVYAPSGRLVRALIDARLPAGRHVASWDGVSSSGRPCGSGVYLCRLECDVDVVTRKLVLMRRLALPDIVLAPPSLLFTSPPSDLLLKDSRSGGPTGGFLTGRAGCGIMNVESHSFTLTDKGEVA
jgi:hypothetical protein